MYWDPYNAVILSEFDGKVRFRINHRRNHFQEESDEQTGHREKVIIDTKDKTKNPAIEVVGAKTEPLQKAYNIPVGAHLGC